MELGILSVGFTVGVVTVFLTAGMLLIIGGKLWR
jgi:hypothetical protein